MKCMNNTYIVTEARTIFQSPLQPGAASRNRER